MGPFLLSTITMSITTKTGDTGTTALLHNRRVPKTDARIKANGLIDELNARLGQARALLQSLDPAFASWLEHLQQGLFLFMGEIAVTPEDYDVHETSKIPKLESAFLDAIETRRKTREPLLPSPSDWSVPGNNPVSACLDLSRTAARQAELALWDLDAQKLLNPARRELLLVSLNRLSDLLWIEARLHEQHLSK